ncbi:nuclear transport factor 2 family protein [Massilia sp. PWRC2]|uniref:nuclear transport factor 2 family protein n=1 Tax=Massilia sp. PWRC2 TaxID=2804626 RepID=UPI003CF23167
MNHRHNDSNANIATLKDMYAGFNARAIGAVLAALADDVSWANGMDGGHEHGLAAVRQYWTAQWAVVSPQVTPLHFEEAADGAVLVQVRQIVRDLTGHPLQGQTHGLHDKLVGHRFHFEGGKVARFDIEEIG